MQFWEKLRKRKLLRWSAAYAAAALATVLALTLSGKFDGAPRLLRMVGVALTTGFVVTVVLSWYHGERGKQRVTDRELAILMVTLLLGGGLMRHIPHPPNSSYYVLGRFDIDLDGSVAEEYVQRWLSASPTSIRAYWESDERKFPKSTQCSRESNQACSDLRRNLEAEIPDRDERIRRLLVMCGSRGVLWDEHPGFDGICFDLLGDYPEDQVIASLQAPKSSDAVLEGAAYYLTTQYRCHGLPPELKERLLDHIRNAGDLDDDFRRGFSTKCLGS